MVPDSAAIYRRKGRKNLYRVRMIEPWRGFRNGANSKIPHARTFKSDASSL